MGYLMAGIPGAVVATIGIFLPAQDAFFADGAILGLVSGVLIR